MAQLGNLLVKGSSRFLNKAYFEDVYICGDVSTGGELNIATNDSQKANLSLNSKRALRGYDSWLRINEDRHFTDGIYCGSGVFRTDGEFQVGDSGNKFKVNNSSLASYVPSTFSAQATFNGGLIASSANISEEICNTLIVKDELRSAKWNIDNITNLGSTFYVSPCIVFTNPSVYVNSISGTIVVLTITDNSITSSTIGGATWTNGSKVKLMGRIGNSALGTINGVLKRDLNSSTAKTAYISLDFPNTDLIKFSAGATYSGSDVGDLKMMMYEVNKNVNGTAKNRPIGILLSSYGENKKPCIDIYNGDIEDGSPVARMGYLNGLPSVNGVSPTGYGFYAAGNAYFSGTLVSSSGKIGGFEISQYKMVNDSGNGNVIGICSTIGQEWAIWAGASRGIDAPFRLGHGGSLYASAATIKGDITATSGKIGGWNITSDSIYVSGTTGMSSNVGKWAFWAGESNNKNGAYESNATFKVGHNGVLESSNATIAGNITATSGKIGKYTIDDYLITGSGSTCTGMGGNQAFWAGSDSSSDAPFRVGYDGKLYASNANISGIINSTDGSIGGWKISTNKLSSSYMKKDIIYSIGLFSKQDDRPSFLLSESWSNSLGSSDDTIKITDKAISLSNLMKSYDSNETKTSDIIIYSDSFDGIHMTKYEEKRSENDELESASYYAATYEVKGITFDDRIKITPNQKVLWEGAHYMNGAQTITFNDNETVSNQLFGIVLVWSGYSNGKANNGDVHTQFIPKWCVDGKSMAFCLTDAYRHIDKYFYVYDDKIVGNNINGTNGTEGGITYDNRYCVLRAVIGV